jgi:hypothetical protein
MTHGSDTFKVLPGDAAVAGLAVCAPDRAVALDRFDARKLPVRAAGEPLVLGEEFGDELGDPAAGVVAPGWETKKL